MSLKSRLEKLRTEELRKGQDSSVNEQNSTIGLGGLASVWSLVIQHVIDRLIVKYGMDDLPAGDLAKQRSLIQEITYSVLQEEGIPATVAEKRRLVEEVLNELSGYGPIEPLVKDPEISEIMVNGPYKVYVEKDGKIQKTGIVFRDAEHVIQIIEKILLTAGRKVDEVSPMADARLPDGSRVNVIIPPLSLKGPVLTIRKFAAEPLEINDLISFGTLNQDMADFLKACIIARLNILISGGADSGKTTTLNVLSRFIPEEERIVTIEDAAELQLLQEHVVTLESRPANVEGKGKITIRDLVTNALRMRPDRIIVGEVRGEEALDMLQAMNTGNDGSITTLHANSPKDCLSRLETMVLMAGVDLPIGVIREQIVSAVNLVIHQSRFRDGTRKITQIDELVGISNNIIVLENIFRFEQTGVDINSRITGKFIYTRSPSKTMEIIRSRGVM